MPRIYLSDEYGGAPTPLLYFQLDFKHCFGNTTKGVDAPSLTVPTRLRQSLDALGQWPRLVSLCVDAFTVLRRCAGTVLAACKPAFDGVRGATPEAIEK